MLSPGFSTPAAQLRPHLLDPDHLPSSSPRHRPPMSVSTPPPQPLSQPVVKPITVHDTITQWFHSIIDRRGLSACAATAGCAGVSFLLVLAALHIHILHPLSTVYNVLSTLVSPSAWSAASAVALLVLAQCTVFNSQLVKPDQMSRASLRAHTSWLSFCVCSVVSLFAGWLSLWLSESLLSADSGRWVLQQGLLAGAAASVWSLDYQLTFPANEAPPRWLDRVSSLLSLSSDSVLMQAVHSAFLVYRINWVLALVSVPLLFGFPSLFWSAIDPRVHFPLVLLLTWQAFSARTLLRMLRQMVMQPMAFPLPPPYTVHSPTPEQTRTLTNVLEAGDKLLKLFALHDLRRIAWSDRARRLDIYSLSQPGGHPRNWATVCSVCVRVLDEVRSSLELAAARAAGVSAAELLADEEDEPNRQMLMMPERARQQMFSSTVRRRFERTAVRPPLARRGAAPSGWAMPAAFNKIIQWTADENLVLSRYDAQVTALAVNSLWMLVVDSFDGDRYGVVQADLAAILSSLLRLVKTVDKYMRTKAQRAYDEHADVGVKQVDAALQTAIYRIHSKFGHHLKSLELSVEEQSLIDMLTNQHM